MTAAVGSFTGLILFWTKLIERNSTLMFSKKMTCQVPTEVYLFKVTFIKRQSKILQWSFLTLSKLFAHSDFKMVNRSHFSSIKIDFSYLISYNTKHPVIHYKIKWSLLSFGRSRLYWTCSLCFDVIRKKTVYCNKIMGARPLI